MPRIPYATPAKPEPANLRYLHIIPFSDAASFVSVFVHTVIPFAAPYSMVNVLLSYFKHCKYKRVRRTFGEQNLSIYVSEEKKEHQKQRVTGNGPHYRVINAPLPTCDAMINIQTKKMAPMSQKENAAYQLEPIRQPS
jgi:hypothetical protein